MSLVHLHLVLNHIPVVGIVVAGILFVIAAGRRTPPLARLAMAFLLAFALLTIPVYLTGEPAEHVVKRLPGVSEDVVERHEDAALASLVAAELLGAAALVALAVFRRTALPRVVAAALIALVVVTTGLFGWTGYLGGQIRHPEIRTASATTTAPAITDSKRHRREH